MKRRPSGSLPISKAVVGLVNHKLAEGLTEHSVNSYERLFKKWVAFEGDKSIDQISTNEIRKYLAWLRTDYVPHRYNRKTHTLLTCHSKSDPKPVLGSDQFGGRKHGKTKDIFSRTNPHEAARSRGLASGR